jgi:LacI family transcriptional regulator
MHHDDPRRASAIAPPLKASTLKDVAQLAGVSLMTASRVVNGKFESVRPATRRKVEQAIKALEYRPNLQGRGLRLSRSLSVGMLILDPLPTFLSDPFTTQLVAGLSNYLSGRDYSLNLQGITPRKLGRALPLRMNGVDAVCVFCSGSPAFRRRVMKRLQLGGQPTILFQETLTAPAGDFCVIGQDDFGGSVALARHLFERGARHMALVVPSIHWPAIAERKRGIEAYLQSLDAETRLDVVSSKSSHFEDVQVAMQHYLDAGARPAALLAGNGQIAVAAMNLLTRHAIRVPQDMMLATFHGFEYRQYTLPTLTSVRSPAYEMGTAGGREVIRRLTAGAFSAAKIELPVELEPGDSTEGWAGEVYDHRLIRTAPDP